jgi:DNA segregation ATPase FtsK/SpoIIIE-like protein
VILDLAEGARAILAGGTPGSGKTGTLTSIVLQLARKNDPGRLALAIVDLKRLDFTRLAALPHLVEDVATTEAEAIDLVAWCVQEMERRQAIMNASGVNRWELLPEGDRFPLLLLVIDEAADFARSDVMASLVELARKSRACGIALIAATQRPDADVFSPQAKANFTTRVAFRTVDRGNSQVILDRVGAEKLARPGLCLTNAGGRWRKVQAAFVPDDALPAWVGAPIAPILDDTERALVRFALDELGGAFTISELYTAFKGEVSQYAIEKLARAWELRGWLSAPAYDDAGRKQARQIMPELAALALDTTDTTLGTLLETQTRPNTADTETQNSAPGGEAETLELPPFLAHRVKSRS